ncbi:hypothetical protein D0A34_03650 [Microcoleus vaginatus PCC 9802]|nr:hypothetical protein D0A34_03650 [Microcoleus vaginatus PCC 9802]
MVSRASDGPDWGEQKTDCATAIPSFFGFWGRIYSLHTIERTDRSAFPILVRDQKNSKLLELLRVVRGGCGGNLKTPLIHQR